MYNESSAAYIDYNLFNTQRERYTHFHITGSLHRKIIYKLHEIITNWSHHYTVYALVIECNIFTSQRSTHTASSCRCLDANDLCINSRLQRYEIVKRAERERYEHTILLSQQWKRALAMQIMHLTGFA